MNTKDFINNDLRTSLIDWVKYGVVILVTIILFLMSFSGGLSLDFSKLQRSEFWTRVIVTNSTYFILLALFITTRKVEEQPLDNEEALKKKRNEVDYNHIVKMVNIFNEKTLDIAKENKIRNRKFKKRLFNPYKLLGGKAKKSNLSIKQIEDRLDIVKISNNHLRNKLSFKLLFFILLTFIMMIGLQALKFDELDSWLMIILSILQGVLAFMDEEKIYESMVLTRERKALKLLKDLDKFDNMIDPDSQLTYE